MSDKKRAPGVAVEDLWTRLKNAGIEVPANVSRIIIDAKAGGVVVIHWSCFADQDLTDVIADVIVDIQKGKRVASGPGTPKEPDV